MFARADEMKARPLSFKIAVFNNFEILFRIEWCFAIFLEPAGRLAAFCFRCTPVAHRG
jgi:hypothetical protein